VRVDAAANREKLLDAAGAVFAEQGLGAPLIAVAKLAGVGNATLYRHFPDKHALIMALAARVAGRFEAIQAEGAAAESGWRGIEIAIDGTVAMYLDFPWLPAVLEYARQHRDDDPGFEQTGLEGIERAWAEGSLRRDIEATDVAFIPLLLSGLLRLPEPMRSIVIARQRDIVLDGFRAHDVPRQPPGGAPLHIQTLRDLVRPSESGMSTSGGS